MSNRVDSIIRKIKMLYSNNNSFIDIKYEYNDEFISEFKLKFDYGTTYNAYEMFGDRCLDYGLNKDEEFVDINGDVAVISIENDFDIECITKEYVESLVDYYFSM